MIDTVQARYGWTDEYILHSIPSERAFMIFEIVASQIAEERKERMREQAFNAWLMGGSDMPLDNYIAKLNLTYVDPDEMAIDNEITSDEAFDIAYGILSRFQPEGRDAE